MATRAFMGTPDELAREQERHDRIAGDKLTFTRFENKQGYYVHLCRTIIGEVKRWPGNVWVSYGRDGHALQTHTTRHAAACFVYHRWLADTDG